VEPVIGQLGVPWVRPGWTRAMKSSGLISRMRFILAKSRLTPPRTGMVWASRLFPCPKGTMGTRCSWAKRRISTTSSRLCG